MKGSAPGAHSIDVGGIGHPWFRCEEDQLFLHEIYYYYFPYLDFTFFFPIILMMSKEGESVCLCFVLKLF
jgi:hypothetical protein